MNRNVRVLSLSSLHKSIWKPNIATIPAVHHMQLLWILAAHASRDAVVTVVSTARAARCLFPGLLAASVAREPTNVITRASK